uniref:Secreted protein n=1 Tax=Angiostrongylus cantonensis TaxID=6313 RepID=A0A0K0CWF3_ANGCA
MLIFFSFLFKFLFCWKTTPAFFKYKAFSKKYCLPSFQTIGASPSFRSLRAGSNVYRAANTFGENVHWSTTKPGPEEGCSIST